MPASTPLPTARPNTSRWYPSFLRPPIHDARNHIASVGYIPHGRELDPDLYTDALLAVEHRLTALQPFPVGSNDIIEAVEHGTVNPGNLVELGELVDGHHPARTSSCDIGTLTC